MNKQAGGPSAAARVVENMLILGTQDHLIPIEQKVSFIARDNVDIKIVALSVLVGVFFTLFKVVKLVFSTCRGLLAASPKDASKKTN